MIVGSPVFASNSSARGTSRQLARLIATRAILPDASAGPGVPTPIATLFLSGSTDAIARAIAAKTASGVAGCGVGTLKDCKQAPSGVNLPSLIAVPPKSIPITCG